MNAFDFKDFNLVRHGANQLKVPMIGIAALSGNAKRIQNLSAVLAKFNLSFNDYTV